MFLSELVSLSSDLSSGAVGTGERSVARRVAHRLFARWRALSGAQKSVFEGRAALGTRENVWKIERNFLKLVTRFATS